jgi:hypothetical protein
MRGWREGKWGGRAIDRVLLEFSSLDLEPRGRSSWLTRSVESTIPKFHKKLEPAENVL